MQITLFEEKSALRTFKESRALCEAYMAIYHLHVRSFSRSKGHSSVAAAAYRSGSKIRDLRTGIQHDYSKKAGVAYTSIIGTSLSRNELWNQIEKVEKAKNASLAKEYEVAIPIELDNSQKVELVQTFCHWIRKTHKCAIDVAIHDIDSHNPHAHILTTNRVVEDYDIGDKLVREWSDARRKKNGYGPRKQDLIDAREKWAELANRYLTQDQQISHLSYAELEIEKSPTIKLGKASHHFYKKTNRKNSRFKRLQEIQNLNFLLDNEPFYEKFEFHNEELLTGEQKANSLVSFLDDEMRRVSVWKMYQSDYDVVQNENIVEVMSYKPKIFERLKSSIDESLKVLLNYVQHRRKKLLNSNGKVAGSIPYDALAVFQNKLNKVHDRDGVHVDSEVQPVKPLRRKSRRR